MTTINDSDLASDLEVKLKQLEINEKVIKNRMLWLTLLVPILTLILTVITTNMTINNGWLLTKEKFRQDQISNLLLSDSELLNSAKKIHFLIESGVFGDEKENAQVKNAIVNLLSANEKTSEHFAEGHIHFIEAYKELNAKPSDSALVVRGFINAIKEFKNSLDYEPNNYKAISMIGVSYYNIYEEVELLFYWDEATKHLKKALDINPNYSYARRLLIELYDSQALSEKACAEISKLTVSTTTEKIKSINKRWNCDQSMAQ